MSEKPGKRLVSKKEYLRAVSKKGGLLLNSWLMFGLSAFYCVAALLFLVFVAVVSLMVVTGRNPGTWARGWDGANAVFAFLIALVGAGIARAMYRTAQKSQEEADRIEIDVIPMTRANLRAVTASETLVRASDLPPSHQKAELLRAARLDQEAPPEELLRASITRGPGRETGHE